MPACHALSRRAAPRTLASLLGLVVATALSAAPYVPSSDDAIVQRLPFVLTRAERARDAAVGLDARNVPLVIAATRDAISRARREGDPREWGRAQALLAPWWSLSDPPTSVRLLRATILQGVHRFDDARRDLDALVDASGEPMLVAQALLTRAGIAQVQGRLDDARRDCERLARSSRAESHAGLLARTCLAELRSLTGDVEAADAALADLHASSRDPWLTLIRAELAQRRGAHEEADRLFARATTGPAPDVYALAAHADWLLDTGRELAALELLQRHDRRADALELRRAMALQRRGDPRATPLAQELRATLAQARLRGDVPHLREEALLALEVERDAARAWPLAQANWQQQKEPIDALVYVRAAQAAGAGREAHALVQRLRAQGWHDVRLDMALRGASR